MLKLDITDIGGNCKKLSTLTTWLRLLTASLVNSRYRVRLCVRLVTIVIMTARV